MLKQRLAQGRELRLRSMSRRVRERLVVLAPTMMCSRMESVESGIVDKVGAADLLDRQKEEKGR